MQRPNFQGGEHQLEATSRSGHSGATSTANQSASNQRVEHENNRADLEIGHRYTYCMKIFNPDKRSKYVMEKFRRYEKFTSPQELRESLMTDYEDLVAEKDDFDIGYSKGRGASKVWIMDEEDLQTMYQSHNKDQEIVLWCEGRQDTADKSVDSLEPATSTGRKRKTSDAARPPPSKRQAIQEEVDEIFSKLSDKHGQQYTAAQYRLWANMLQVGTHRDYASLPQVPMFGFNSRSSKGSGSEGNLVSCVIEGFARALKGQSGRSSPPSTASHAPRATLDDMGVSPIKCATLRSQYIEQLKQLHQLLELTAVTKEEYEQQKDIILE